MSPSSQLTRRVFRLPPSSSLRAPLSCRLPLLCCAAYYGSTRLVEPIVYEGASSSASIATTSTLPLRTEPYDPFNAFGPLLDVYDALDAAAIGALKDRIEMVRPLLPFFVHARRLLSSRICSPPSPSPQVAFNLHARRFIEEKLICFPRSSTSTPRFDSVLDDFLPKPTDATSSSAAGVIDMQEDLNVSVLQHSTFHVRVVCCLAPREVHSRCHHPPFLLFA